MKAQEIHDHQVVPEIHGRQSLPPFSSRQFDWGPFLTLLLLCMGKRMKPREWGSSGIRCREARLPLGCIAMVRCSSR